MKRTSIYWCAHTGTCTETSWWRQDCSRSQALQGAENSHDNAALYFQCCSEQAPSLEPSLCFPSLLPVKSLAFSRPFNSHTSLEGTIFILDENISIKTATLN